MQTANDEMSAASSRCAGVLPGNSFSWTKAGGLRTERPRYFGGGGRGGRAGHLFSRAALRISG
jgi:hypothetical protein